MFSTDTRAYFLCSEESAINLYDYLGKYTEDKVIKFDGDVHYIQRELSDNVFCSNMVPDNRANCAFNLDIDNDVIEEEEAK